VAVACGGGGTPGASPTATERAAFEKDEVKTTVSERTTAPGSETPRPPPPPQPLAFDFIDTENGWLAFGNTVSTTVLATSDGGHSWTELSSTPTEVKSVDFISASQGWMSTGEGLFATLDGGHNWEKIGNGLPEGARVRFIDASRGWAVVKQGVGSYLSASTDGGQTWSSVDIPCRDTLRMGADLIDSSTGWLACGGQGATIMEAKGLYRTRDFGQHWEPVSCACFGANPQGVPNTMPSSGHLYDIYFLDESHGWLDSGRGGLSATEDGGLSWRSVPTGVLCAEEFTTEAHFLSAQVGYVIASRCGGVGNLLSTTDGGTTWSSLYPPPFLENCSTPELRQGHDPCASSSP
jgi:photosystem II stability/assembly factor-like uncharacterized protein